MEHPSYGRVYIISLRIPHSATIEELEPRSCEGTLIEQLVMLAADARANEYSRVFAIVWPDLCKLLDKSTEQFGATGMHEADILGPNDNVAGAVTE